MRVDRYSIRIDVRDSLKSAFDLVPADESVTQQSLHADVPRRLTSRLGLWDVHGEDTVLALTADCIRVDILWKREASFEASVAALDAMVLFAFVIFLLLAFPLDADDSRVERDLNILLLDGR
jgi:hypothetical protein